MTNVAAELISMFETRRDSIAIVAGNGTETTYAELLAAIARGRGRLVAASLAPGSKVVVQVPKGLPFASATVALAAEGHAAVGIEMAQGDAVYQDRSRYVGADAVITTRKVRAIQRSTFLRHQLANRGIAVPPPLAAPDIDWDSATPAAKTSAVYVASDEDIVFVVFTGGTAGQPKGVQLSHRSVRHYLAGLARLPEWPMVTSLVADHPQQVLYGLAHGKTVYLSPNRSTARARRTAELLFEEGVDCYFGSPASWTEILATGMHHRATTWPQAVLLGGAPVTRPMLELLARELDPSVSIRCLYGMSEAGLVAHISAADKLSMLRSSEHDGDPVGEIAPDVTVSSAADGELLVASPARFSGYVGGRHANADEAFPTGDIGRLENNMLFLLGRKKNMIVQNGVNLYPEQFEGRLLGQRLGDKPAFEEVALIAGPPDRLGDEHFVLFYVSSSTNTASTNTASTNTASTNTASALALARNVLPAGHSPTQAIRVDALPRTGRQNKIDRRTLAAQLEGRANQSLTAMQAELFAHILHLVPARSWQRPRALALRALTRRNLARCQQLPEQPVAPLIEPVFILGHQRSGTTLLHHALASSPSATTFALADMIAPHPLGWRASNLLARPTRGMFAVAKKLPRWRAVLERHDVDPTAPEEEEWLFAALGLSGFLPSAFQATLGSSVFDELRDRSSWPPETRRSLVELYATILARWYGRRPASGPIRHIAKNPAFAAMATDLLATFPAARFVVALRDPHEAICSRVALVSAIHHRTLRGAEVEVLVNDSLCQLRSLSDQVSMMAPDRVHAVGFRELMRDPRGVVDRTCSFAGIEPPAALPVVRRSAPTEPPAGVPTRHEIAAEVPGFVELCARWDLVS